MNTTISESDILNEMVSPDVQDFPPEAAQALLSLRFTARAVERMDELAEKNRLDAISPGEKEEMAKFMRVGNLLSFLKAKARLSLSKHDAMPSSSCFANSFAIAPPTAASIAGSRRNITICLSRSNTSSPRSTRAMTTPRTSRFPVTIAMPSKAQISRDLIPKRNS
jgi:hypothetical protein